MAKLVVFYSRADENYFSGSYRYVTEGNTEKVAKMIAAAVGADRSRLSKRFRMPPITILVLSRQKMT